MHHQVLFKVELLPILSVISECNPNLWWKVLGAHLHLVYSTHPFLHTVRRSLHTVHTPRLCFEESGLANADLRLAWIVFKIEVCAGVESAQGQDRLCDIWLFLYGLFGEGVYLVSQIGEEIFAIWSELLNGLYHCWLALLHRCLDGRNNCRRGSGGSDGFVSPVELESPCLFSLGHPQSIVLIQLLRTDVIFGVAHADFTLIQYTAQEALAGQV